MKPKIILCLALVLSSGLVGYSNIAHADETNSSTLTNAAQSYVTATVKTNWMDAKVNLYRAIGGAVQLDAKREVVTIRYGPYTYDLDVLAFVNPETGNAWVGLSANEQIFYLESESGIIGGKVHFTAMALGAARSDELDVINGSMAYGDLYWDRSLVPNAKRGEDVDAVIEQFNKNNDLKSVATAMHRERTTVIENSLQRVETGLNPWFFLDERHGSQFAETTIEAIDVSDGKLRLDLKNPTGSHKASVWIDLKTWQVVKVVQDGKP
jgi:hypothetical protein